MAKDKKSILKIVVPIILAVAVFVGAMAPIIKYLIIPAIHGDGEVKYDAPTNITFDENERKFKWDGVEGVSSYALSIYHDDEETSTNLIVFNNYYSISSSFISYKTHFKVCCYDFSKMKAISDYSEPFEYNVKMDEVNRDNLTCYVANMRKDLTLAKIVSIYHIDNVLYLNANFTKRDEAKKTSLYQIKYTFAETITSLKSVILSKAYGEYELIKSKEFKDYDSMKYYLQSSSLKGELGTYKSESYSLSSSSSRSTYRIDTESMGVAGIVRAVKGLTKTYLAYRYEFEASDIDPESIKYTSALVNINESSVLVYESHILEGEDLEVNKVIYPTI